MSPQRLVKASRRNIISKSNLWTYFPSWCFVLMGLVMGGVIGMGILGILIGIPKLAIWVLGGEYRGLVVLAWGSLIIGLGIYYFNRWGKTLNEETEKARQRNYIIQQTKDSFIRTAMQRANVGVTKAPFVLTDLGLLVYENEQNSPYISREKPLPLDTDFIRPFILLWVAEERTHRVAIEILDHNKKLIFYEAFRTRLKETTTIISDKWLSVKAYNREGNPSWSLRVTVDGELLAVHYIKWGSFRWKDIPYQAMTDGEMDKRTSRLVDNDILTSMSLDDLLTEETDELASREGDK